MLASSGCVLLASSKGNKKWPEKLGELLSRAHHQLAGRLFDQLQPIGLFGQDHC
jgi:hypothetical protein